MEHNGAEVNCAVGRRGQTVSQRFFSLSISSQFLVYFFYLAILTLVYLISAVVDIITRHCRNRPAGGTNGQTPPVELQPVATTAEEPQLSNGQSGKV